MKKAVLCFVVFLMVSVGATVAHAQSFSLPKVTDINAYSQVGGFTGRNSLAKDHGPTLGWGFEISLDTSGVDSPSASACTRQCLPDEEERARAEARRPPPKPWLFEVGFGYSQLAVNQTVAGGNELRAGLRTIPSVMIYMSRNIKPLEGAFVGLGSGIETLKDGRLYNSMMQFAEVGGETISFSGTAGYALLIFDKVALFFEGAYHLRYFPSVTYKLPGSSTTLPPDYPRAANLSGWTFSVGLQVAVQKP